MNHLTQSNLNSGLVALESIFNIAGYLPNVIKVSDKHNLRTAFAETRFKFGFVMTVSSVALMAIGYVANVIKPDYTDLHKKAVQYIGHGILNMMRSFVEDKGFGALTLAYDFNGEKFMSYNLVDPKFDLQAKYFTYMKGEIARLDITHFISKVSTRVSTFVRSYI